MVEDFTHEGCFAVQKKGKLRHRHISAFEILERVGEVAYKLALSPSLFLVHLVFHVSMFLRYIPNDSHVLSLDSVKSSMDLTYKEEPVAILDRQVWKLRIKEIALVKI